MERGSGPVVTDVLDLAVVGSRSGSIPRDCSSHSAHWRVSPCDSPARDDVATDLKTRGRRVDLQQRSRDAASSVIQETISSFDRVNFVCEPCVCCV